MEAAFRAGRKGRGRVDLDGSPKKLKGVRGRGEKGVSPCFLTHHPIAPRLGPPHPFGRSGQRESAAPRRRDEAEAGDAWRRIACPVFHAMNKRGAMIPHCA